MVAKQHLPSPGELQHTLPLTASQAHFIYQVREQIIAILSGSDLRQLLVVGPCSIHDITAAKEYAIKLKKLAEEVQDSFLIVMRNYFEKPRTRLGWKGLLHDPYLNGGNDIAEGLKMARQLLLDLTDLEVPAATEFLDPASTEYYGDLISWGCIGARTSSSQIHRQIASGLHMPIAFKNSTDGNVDSAIHGVQAASVGHTYIGMDSSGKVAMVHSNGNSHAHVMLRGGEKGPNYDSLSVQRTLAQLEKAGCKRRLLIDCSHDNCNKQADKQAAVFQDVINQVLEGNDEIRGLMLESHLYGGNQVMHSEGSLQYGVSLTDPCLDWETTERLILDAHALLSLNVTETVQAKR